MANIDSPFGLRPIRHKSGAPYNGAVNPYVIEAADSTGDVFIGDPVVRVAGGSNTASVTVPGAGTFAIGTLPSVIGTVAGDVNGATKVITGVVVGFAADPTNLERQYRADDTQRVCFVCDDPDVVFEVQANGIIGASLVGLNANLVEDHAGSTVTGLSGTELNITTPSADISNQLRILRVVNREDVDTDLTHSKVEVVINQHTESQNHFAHDGTAGTLGI